MRTSSAILALAFAFAFNSFSCGESARILAIFPFPGRSQFICVEPYLKAIALRGHELTVISMYPQTKPLANWRDIEVTEMRKHYDAVMAGIYKERYTYWSALNAFKPLISISLKQVLDSPAVQELLHSDEHFDLLILEPLRNEPLFGFAEHFKAPIIGISTYGMDPHLDEYVGNISPLSFTPLYTVPLTDHMNFWQRLLNLWWTTVERVHLHTIMLPYYEEVYKHYFPNSSTELKQLRKNMSLLLLNQHFSLSYPRPYVPNVIEVGGIFLPDKANPLPADMEHFISSSPLDVIYFSLGTNVRSKNLPKEKLEALLNVFGSLNVNVLWKFEDTELPGKPNNVYISKWFPQFDLLAHPKVKLFIMHGGLLGTIEAIHNAKPLIGMPVFFDQFLNVAQAVQSGFGLHVDIKTFTADNMKRAILEVLNNPKYTEKAKELSRQFHDQPMKPLDTAIYWTEYVLRHKGAPHMRATSKDLNFIQLNSLDTGLVLFGGLAGVLVLTLYIWCKLCAKLYAKLGNSNTKKRKRD
ncbi:UDP-glycosyltransferase UGT5 [Zeugodacus cucurbitae]|uniref:UDP-glucuronosyltransferase n=1 Tax=Zeugodacus cucurbitae TaxID=28588 RepID=A0A0A1X1E1_ZEUCU|nr:UDP-glycosyltransferase UGT5 [Zeugodacus cucurbitae]